MPDEFPRESLLAVLNDTAHLKMSVLVAPSGYGKTTLLAQWVRTNPAPTVWVRLDDECRDPRFLLATLIEGCRKLGMNTPELPDASDFSVGRDRPLAAFLHDLGAHDCGLRFVLDGGEYLSADSAKLLSAFAAQLDTRHRVLLAQHDASAFRIAPFLLRGEGLVLDMTQLCFQPAELDLLTQQLKASGMPGQLGAFEHQGWPAGVMLALRSRSLHVSPGDLIADLMSRLPQTLQQTLCQAVVADVWTPDLALERRLPLPAHWLDEVLRVGFPLTPLGGQRYLPHDVLRTFLQQQLAQHPELARALFEESARRAIHEGAPYRALLHFLRAGRADLAAGLAEQLVPLWYAAADWLLVKETLAAFDSAVLSSELQSVLALAYVETGDPERALALASGQHREQRATPTTYFVLGVLEYRAARYQEALRWLELGFALARVPRDLIQLKRLYGSCLLELDRSEEAMAVAREASQLARRHAEPGLALSVSPLLANILFRQGRGHEALAELEQAYTIGKDAGFTHRLMPIVRSLAFEYLHANAPQRAQALLTPHLSVCEGSYPLYVAPLKSMLSAALFAQGQFAEGYPLARQAFERHLEDGQYIGAEQAIVNVLFHDLARGRTLQARADYERFVQLGGNVAAADSELIRRTLLAYLQHAEGNIAGEALQHAEYVTEQAPLVLGEASWPALLLRAELRRQQGRLCQDDLACFVDLLAVEGGVANVLRPMYPLFKALIDEGLERGWFTAELERVQELCSPFWGRQAGPAVLHITTLGTSTLTLDGHAVQVGHATAFEMLVYAVLHPEVRQDELASVVWEDQPDLQRARASAQEARHAVNSALRQVSGGREFSLLPAQRGRRNPHWKITDQVRVRCDALQLLASRQPQEVLRLYQGPFLAFSDTEWVRECRQRLAGHAARVLEGAAVTCQEADTALDWLVRAAQLDPCAERYERLIELALRCGKTDLAAGARLAMRDLERGEWPVLLTAADLG